MNNKRLFNLRKENSLTQQELANRLGVGRTTINGYEKGTITPPSDKLNKLAEILGVTTDYLLGNSDNKTLNQEDIIDIADKMNTLLNEIKLSQSALTFNGSEMDDLTKELLIKSLQNSLEMGKAISKNKGR